MFAKLLLFFTTLFSVFNVNNTCFNASDIVKPSYQLNTNTGTNNFNVKVNLYDKDQTTLINTGSFSFTSSYTNNTSNLRDTEVLPNIYANFWRSIPHSTNLVSGSTSYNISNFKNYTYSSTTKSFTYNFGLSSINLTGTAMRIFQGNTSTFVATADFGYILDNISNLFTSSLLTNYLNTNVYNASLYGYQYNFWLGGSLNSFNSLNNPDYIIQGAGPYTISPVLVLFPVDYSVLREYYNINAFYSNNGLTGIYQPLLSYKSIDTYIPSDTPTIIQLTKQYLRLSTFSLNDYKVAPSSFVDSNSLSATLYFYISPNTNREVVDIWGLAFSMITLPFTFFSTAFNLTIFEGTPYAFNFSWFLISVLCLLVLITLIKLILMFRK